MIVIIAGPSGSGKTTFIQKLLSVEKKFNVIPVDVISQHRIYEEDLGRRQISNIKFSQKEKRGYYTHTYVYENSKYGFCLNKLSTNGVYILDYPGEYPQCGDLASYDWIGVLLIPPSEQVLSFRLNLAGRTNRIKSAIIEYRECLTDIEQGKFNDWIIVKNDTYLDILSGIQLTINRIKDTKKSSSKKHG